MRFSGYQAYRESNSPWLGDIPAHWETKKLKFLATVQPSNVDKKTVEGEELVFLCNYTDVYKNEYIDGRLDFMQASATEDEIRKFAVDIGDVIVTKDSETPDDIAVPACVAEKIDGLLCGYHLTQIKPIDLDGKYLFRLFQSKGFNAQFTVAANGVTRFGLPQYAIANSFAPVPPINEQQTIARFLDFKTAQIDALIAKKKALLDKLAEMRTAIISHAVTMGLDPSVPMKDSGVAWLGEIPAHWELVKLGRKIQLQRGVDITKGEQADGDVPVVSSGGIASFHNVAYAKGPGVIVGRKGTAGAVYYVDSDYWPHDTTLWVKNFGGNMPRYVFYKLAVMDLASFDTGSSNPTINRNLVHPTVVSWPPMLEQKEIANHIDRRVARIERQCSKINSAILLLKEYRSALITNVVTGKIDVRGFVIPPRGNEC